MKGLGRETESRWQPLAGSQQKPHAWREFLWREQRFWEVESVIAPIQDPFTLFESLPATEWRYLWRDKEAASTIMGCQALALSSEVPHLDQHVAAFRFFGGIPFAATTTDSKPFHSPTFFLPQIEWEIGDQRTVMRERFSVPAAVAFSWDEVERLRISHQLHLTSAAVSLLPHIEHVVEHMTFPEWEQKIAAAQSAFRDGGLQKVVLSRSKSLHLSARPSIAHILQQLAQSQDEAFMAAVGAPDQRIFITRSPERLLKWDGRSIQVDAIAGTRKRSGDISDDENVGNELKCSTKDLEEHAFVQHYVEDVLQNHCSEWHKTAQNRLLKLRHVQHMVTHFMGILKDSVAPEQVLRALHPTPAVGGVPLQPALDFLDRVEGWQRGWFAGAIGWTSGLHGDFAIGIRSAILDDNHLEVHAGAGIVTGSNAADEWQETELKMQNFLQLFTPKDLAYVH